MNELSAAWVLHSRPYKERSVIAECLVQGHGRVAMVVQGVRKTKSRSAALIQPFTRVLVSWRGKSELKTLLTIEPSRSLYLTGKHLYSGFYLNELLMRSILPGQDPEGVFDLYEMILSRLSEGVAIEPLLRLFELDLLELLGYMPDLTFTADTGDAIKSDGVYQFHAEYGFTVARQPSDRERPFCFTGEVLLALAARDFSQQECFPGFKRFTRLALLPLVGSKPLKSRTLFRPSSREKLVHGSP